MRLSNTVWLILASSLFVMTLPGYPNQTTSPASSELPSESEYQEIGCPIQIEMDDRDLQVGTSPVAGLYYEPLDGTGSRSTPRVLAEEYSYRINIIARARPRAGRIFLPPTESHRLSIPDIAQIELKDPRVQSGLRPNLEP